MFFSALSPALVPVQKSSVSVARVREDRGHAHRYSGSHLPHESLYKVRSESANNKLNFKVLLELGPDTGMPHEAQTADVTQRSRGNVDGYQQRYSNHRSSGGYTTRQDNYEVRCCTCIFYHLIPCPWYHTIRRHNILSSATFTYMTCDNLP